MYEDFINSIWCNYAFAKARQETALNS